MKLLLSPEQSQDIVELQAIAREFDAALVIIGAIALACFLDHIGRGTNDIDLVIALDLEVFHEFTSRLISRGWTREPKLEHRWRSPRASRIDLLPAGPSLRVAKRIVWPESEFEMNLVGFDHVFAYAVSVEFAKDTMFLVAPPSVVALLKIVAHLDDPHRRAKDLLDLKILLGCYQTNTDRIFCDEVFDAELEDIEYASAFLLGLDIGKFATQEDLAVVRAFTKRYRTAELDHLDPADDRAELQFQRQIRAFEQGLATGR